MLRVLLLVLLVLWPGAALAAERICAPTSLVKVVVALDLPDLPRDHVARTPRTVYRYGRRMGRLEEVSAQGVPLLIVVAKPNTWTVQRGTKIGQHVRDPSPDPVLFVPVFDDPGITSKLARTLQFGCEADWLLAAGATRARVEHATLGKIDRLEYREGNEVVLLYLRADHPARLELLRAGRLVRALDYLEYNADLPFRAPLFQKPEGYEFGKAAR
jgi:hypothetical protein